MIKRFLVRLRHKPKHVRDGYALGMAGSFTAVVLLIWLYHWPSNVAERAANRAEGTGPFSQFMDQARKQVGAARESVTPMPAVAPPPSANHMEATVKPTTTKTMPESAPTVPIRIATTTRSTTTREQ